MIPEEFENIHKSKPYERKQFISNLQRKQITNIYQRGNAQGGQFSQNDYIKHETQEEAKNELIRSVMRIQQSREQPIDYLVKVLYTYKGICELDPKSLEIMKEPKKFTDKLNLNQLYSVLKTIQCFIKAGLFENEKYEYFWINLIKIIQEKINSKAKGLNFEMKPEYQEKVKQVLKKPIQQLIKLKKKINILLKNPSFTIDENYWEYIIKRIQVKEAQHKLTLFYKEFKAWYTETKEIQIQEQQKQYEQISPVLISAAGLNPKLITTEEQEKFARTKMGQKIFKEEFQKAKEKLQVNLSLPKNHELLSKQILTESATASYGKITKQIIEFEKYRRMQEDEQEFHDEEPIQTQGRFRYQKPYFLNRVRVSYEQANNKFNQNHFNEDNPPPKSILGYKFNIFYPELYDKNKTPQYYLSASEDPNFMIITFKAGPPYKDVAFRIQRREWDYSEKSGFESMFDKGIINLYFNFKKPRYRI